MLNNQFFFSTGFHFFLQFFNKKKMFPNFLKKQIFSYKKYFSKKGYSRFLKNMMFTNNFEANIVYRPYYFLFLFLPPPFPPRKMSYPALTKLGSRSAPPSLVNKTPMFWCSILLKKLTTSLYWNTCTSHLFVVYDKKSFTPLFDIK